MLKLIMLKKCMEFVHFLICLQSNINFDYKDCYVQKGKTL